MGKAIETGGPAFPRGGCEWTEDQGDGSFAQDGMTLRDYFAAASLTGIQANTANNKRNIFEDAALAYETADAMIAARKGGAV